MKFMYCTECGHGKVASFIQMIYLVSNDHKSNKMLPKVMLLYLPIRGSSAHARAIIVTLQQIFEKQTFSKLS